MELPKGFTLEVSMTRKVFKYRWRGKHSDGYLGASEHAFPFAWMAIFDAQREDAAFRRWVKYGEDQNKDYDGWRKI